MWHHLISPLLCVAQWGLANGVAAAFIIRDLIRGGEAALESNPYAKMVRELTDVNWRFETMGKLMVLS
jgi:hypothetical protein